MDNLNQLVTMIKSQYPDNVRTRELDRDRVMITLSTPAHPDIFSVEVSQAQNKLLLGNYLLKRNSNQKSEDAILQAIGSIIQAANTYQSNPRGQAEIQINRTYRSFIDRGSYVSRDDKSWTETGALEFMDTALPPIIPGSKDVYVTNKYKGPGAPKNVLFRPALNPGDEQSITTFEQYATLSGVHYEAGEGVFITPFPKAKASKTTSSHRPLAPHQDVIKSHAVGISVIEQPGVENIAVPVGYMTTHQSWTSMFTPGAAAIPVEHANDKFGTVGVKSQGIDINRLHEISINVSAGSIKRGDVLATYGADKIVSDQNALVTGVRIVVPDTQDTRKAVERMKNSGEPINPATGLPFKWEYGGTGKSARLVFDVERWRTVEQHTGLSHKFWGVKSLATKRDVNAMRTVIDPITLQPVTNYENPDLELGYESHKGSSLIQSLGLLLGTTDPKNNLREKALAEIARHKPHLHAILSQRSIVPTEENQKAMAEAAQFLFIEREWTPDLPVGGVTERISPVIGRATTSKDGTHGMIPAKVLSFLSTDPNVGFGRKAIQTAIADGLASPDTTVKVYRHGKLIYQGDEILSNEHNLQPMDEFRLEGVTRATRSVFPLLPRGEYAGRNPRFSFDELSLQASTIPATVKHMVQVAKRNTDIYRDVMALSKGGIPASRSNEVLVLNTAQRAELGIRYKDAVIKLANASGFQDTDPWAIPDDIRRAAAKYSLEEMFVKSSNGRITPRDLGHMFIKLDEFTVLEPMAEIQDLSHFDLSGKEKTGIVRSWFKAFEEVISNPNEGAKSRAYVSHEAIRRDFASQEGVRKSATSIFTNISNVILNRGTLDEQAHNIHSWEGPYQIAEEVPAGYVVMGTEVLRKLYTTAFGEYDEHDFKKWQRQIRDDAIGIEERRPGVSNEQGGQITKVMPLRYARDIGLDPKAYGRNSVYVSGGTSFASRQNADSDADRMILAIFGHASKLSDKVRAELKDSLIKTINGTYVEEFASSRYPGEYDPSMSPERAAFLGGDETQIEMGKEMRDIAGWAGTGWRKRTHMTWDFINERNPFSKLVVPHKITGKQLEESFSRQVQFKNTDVGFQWIYSAPGRLVSELLGLQISEATARRLQAQGAMNYQSALDVGDIIIGRRVADMSKSLTLGETYRPSDESNPVALNNFKSDLLPNASKDTGLINNLVIAATEEYVNGRKHGGSISARDIALKFVPLDDTGAIQNFANALENLDQDPMASRITMMTLLSGVGKHDILQKTIAGSLILHERSRAWLNDPKFANLPENMQALIKNASIVRSGYKGFSGDEDLTPETLQALINTKTSYGTVAGEFIQDFTSLAITKQPSRFDTAEQAKAYSEAKRKEYWSKFRGIIEGIKAGRDPQETWAEAVKYGRSAGLIPSSDMNSRSPSQLHNAGDIIAKNLFKSNERVYMLDQANVEAMVRGNVTEYILNSYFTTRGYDTQKHTFDLGENARIAMMESGFSGKLDLFRPGNSRVGPQVYDIKTTDIDEYNRQYAKALQFATQAEINAGKAYVLAPAKRWPQVQAYMSGQQDIMSGGIKYVPKQAWSDIKGGVLANALKLVSDRHQVKLQGSEGQRAMELELKDMLSSDPRLIRAGKIDMNEISSELVKRMVTARIPEYSAILKYATDYYEKVNGVMENLQEIGEIPRQISERDPEFEKAYRMYRPQAQSEAEARGHAFAMAGSVYEERLNKELTRLGIPIGSYIPGGDPTPFLRGTPLEHDHKVYIELPDVDNNVVGQTQGIIEKILASAGLANPNVIRTTGKNTSILEFSVPSDKQVSSDPKLKGFKWEQWLKEELAPSIRGMSPLSAVSVHSPPDQNNPDPESTVKSLSDRYMDIMKINTSGSTTLGSVNLQVPQGYNKNILQEVLNLVSSKPDMVENVLPMGMYHTAAMYAIPQGANQSRDDWDAEVQKHAVRTMALHAANIEKATGRGAKFIRRNVSLGGLVFSPPNDPNDPTREFTFAEYVNRPEFQAQSSFFTPQEYIDITGSVTKNTGSGSAQSQATTPNINGPQPIGGSGNQGNGGSNTNSNSGIISQANWWMKAANPYAMYGSNTGYREAVEIAGNANVNNRDNQNKETAWATRTASQYERLALLQSGPQSLSTATKISEISSGLQTGLEKYHKEYRTANANQSSPELDAEHHRLSALGKEADQLRQNFIKLNEVAGKFSSTLDKDVGQVLKNTVVNFADVVQQRGLTKKELQDLVEARDKLTPSANAGSGLSAELIKTADSIMNFQAAKARMHETGYEEPEVMPKRTRLQKAKEAGSAAEDMAFGNTAFRIRMGLNLTTGNQKQWMNEFMQQQQLVAQAGLMMGAGPSGSGISTYVQAMNRTANRTAELGEGAAQVLVPMQSFLAGAGGKPGFGSALTMIGNAAGAGMVATYASPALGKMIQHLPGMEGVGEGIAKNSGKIGGIAALTAFIGLGAGYVSGEANNWEKEEPNTWSAAWRYKFSEDRDTYRKYSTATKETFPGSGIPAESLLYKAYQLPVVGEIAKALDPIGVGRSKAREKEWMAYQRKAWLESGEGKTWAAEQQVAQLYPGVKTGEATYTLSYLARQTGEPVDNLVSGKYSPGFKELADTQMNFTAAGLTTQQINQAQESVLRSQGVMVGTKESENLLLSVGRMGAQNNEVAQILYGALAPVAQLQGYAATDAQRSRRQAYIAAWNNSIEEGSARDMAVNYGKGGLVDTYRTSPQTSMRIGSYLSNRLPTARDRIEYEGFQASLAPNLLSAGADPMQTAEYIKSMYDRGMQDKSYQADNMTVVARQVSIETGNNALSAMSSIEGIAASGIAQGSWGTQYMKNIGQAGLAPYGMMYGGIAAQQFESQLTSNPVTDKFEGTAVSILRAGGRGGAYNKTDIDRVTSSIMTYGVELTKTFEDLTQGISDVTERVGMRPNSAASTSWGYAALAATAPGASAYNPLTGALTTENTDALAAQGLQAFAMPYAGSIVPHGSSLKNFVATADATQRELSGGSLTINQAQTQVEYAGMTTPLALAQYFAGTLPPGVLAGQIPNGIPGMQTVDQYGLSYGQYTPWTNVAAMMAGEGRDLESLTQQYITRGNYVDGTERWNALQAKYQEAPMYQQQAQVQIAQISAQIASSQIDYNATYGGGGYVGSANFARKLQWGEGPSVTPSEVYAERQRQQTEYKLANIGVENPKPFEFNPQMGSSTVSIAQQENAIRREMAQTQMQWRKQDIGFAMQGLEIQRQQLALARQQLALSRQEAEITRAYKLEERDTQRSVTLMQRSWTQADWSKNRGRFAVETQWQEEDFSRNIRFATGREYIQARREQERTRTRRGWQQEDTNTGEDRQKQLWKIEDDRYQKAIEYENQIWEIQQQKFALQERSLDLQQQSIDLQAAQQAAQMARLEQQQKWQDEEWKLEDKRWELERAQFDEQLKKGQEIYNVRMGVLNKELELAQTQGQHEAGIAAALILQNDLAGKLGDARVVTGADAIIKMINAIVAQYGALGPGGSGTEKGDSNHAAGGTITLPTKLVRGGRVVGLMAERGPEAIIPLSSMMPRSSGSSETTVIQFILDGEVIMEKVVTPDRLSPVMKEVNERTRWR